MNDIFYVLILIIDILVIQDVFKKIRGEVPRFLWVVCVIFLPLFGAAFWYYVQYHAPKEKRNLKEKRNKKLRK